MTHATDDEATDALFAAADAVDGDLPAKLAYYERTARGANPSGAAQYDRLVQLLGDVGAGRNAPKKGEPLPDFALPNHAGALIELSDLVERGPVVVSFNRGHWCPYCRLELRALARLTPALAARGASCVAITPDATEFASLWVSRDELPFHVLTDHDLGYAMSLGLAVSVGQEVAQVYRRLGVDLPRYQGNGSWLVPIPATFVVAKNRLISAVFAHVDFRQRMPMDTILRAVEGRSST